MESDVEDLEHRLYAEIHHSSGFSPKISVPSNLESKAVSILCHSNDEVQMGSKCETSARKKSRYWNRNDHSRFSHVHRGNGSKNQGSTDDFDDPNKIFDVSESGSKISTKTTMQLKTFTPYISMLSHENWQVTPTSAKPILNFRRERPSLSTKPLKKIRVDQTKMQIENTSETSKINEESNKPSKRLNPFSALSLGRLAIKSKSAQKNGKSSRNLEKESSNINVIDIDDDDDDDDDDLIVLPTEAPPLICVDSSDEDLCLIKNNEEHEFVEPIVAIKRSTSGRCESPSSSVQSSDDFVVHRENFGLSSFANLSDEDLYEVSETVTENAWKGNDNYCGKSSSLGINNIDFILPKQKRKSIRGEKKNSYEVSKNSFAAMDVYESESSDMPDSIYIKGRNGKRKNNSNSDSDSIESVILTRAKRLRKRKISGSSREKSAITDESSSELIGKNDLNDLIPPNETTHIVCGEALNAVNLAEPDGLKSIGNFNNKNSDFDFMNKLSSILHGNLSDDNDVKDHENSIESVEARDIVESVLHCRFKKYSEKANEKIDQNKNMSEVQTNECQNDVNSACFEEMLTNLSNGYPEFDVDVDVGWNAEMKRFYNNSWGGENFSVKNIHANMPSKPNI